MILARLESLLKNQPGSRENLQLVGYVVSRVLEKNGVAAANFHLLTARKDQLQTARLTSADGLPDGVKVVAGALVEGRSFASTTGGFGRRARDFQIHLGDDVKFQVAGRPLEARVVAVFNREGRAPVRYDLVFPQVALEGISGCLLRGGPR